MNTIQNTIQIRFECEQFAKKLMEFNPNVIIDFNVFDPSEMAEDMEGKNGNQSK